MLEQPMLETSSNDDWPRASSGVHYLPAGKPTSAHPVEVDTGDEASYNLMGFTGPDL